MENVQCNWTTVEGDWNLNPCKSFNTIKDTENLQPHWFCEDHSQKVKEIRLEMFIKKIKECGLYVNKINLTLYLETYIKEYPNVIFKPLEFLLLLIEKIKKGDLD